MQLRFIAVAACAALALGARGYAGDDHKGATSASAQAGDSQAPQRDTPAGEAAQPGTERDSPGILPDEVEEDRVTEADPALQPTEAERRAGGAIGREPGTTKSVIGTVEQVEPDRLTLRTGTQGETQELRVDQSTKFTSEGLSVSRDNIAEGDEVRASFHGDSMRATEIHVMSRGAASQEQERSQPESQPGQPGSSVTSPPSKPAGTERGESAPAHPGAASQR